MACEFVINLFVSIFSENTRETLLLSLNMRGSDGLLLFGSQSRGYLTPDPVNFDPCNRHTKKLIYVSGNSRITFMYKDSVNNRLASSL